MTKEDARQKANDAIENMHSMNATSEHPPSKAAGAMASIIIDLCSQLDAYDSIELTQQRAEYLVAEKSATDAIAAEEARVKAEADALEEAKKNQPAPEPVHVPAPVADDHAILDL